MNKNINGFTVVEVMLVVAVVVILSTIGIVAYQGTVKRSRNATKLTEIKEWQKSFIQYKSTHNGKYPAMADGGYCLGVSFTNGRCNEYDSGTNFYTEIDSVNLMNELYSYDPPTNYPRIPVNELNGPYAVFSDGSVQLVTIMEGDANDCPDGTHYLNDDGKGAVRCHITLED